MDELRNELGIERRVVISESVELPRQSVQALVETIDSVFRASKNRPIRILYEKGEPLIVERLVPESALKTDNEFLTAWQMIRQHAVVEILEGLDSPMAVVCRAATSLAEKGYTAMMLVASNRGDVDEWFSLGKIDAVFRLPFVEDPDCPDRCLIFCGSQAGTMIGNIEYAVVCRMDTE